MVLLNFIKICAFLQTEVCNWVYKVLGTIVVNLSIRLFVEEDSDPELIYGLTIYPTNPYNHGKYTSDNYLSV